KTIEFWPHEGKYHFDGHRNCNVCLDPAESIKLNNKCPKCNRPLTIGVAHRVEELADRPEGFTPKNAIPFETLIPVSELLSKLFAKGVATKYVWEEYYKLLKSFKSEYDILLNVPLEKLKAVTHPRVAEILIMNRNRQLSVKPGYDGVYGDVEVDPIDGKAKETKQEEIVQKQETKQKSTPWRGQSSLMDF
ncbi:endonuclease Q family protein, partial [Candidatus Woesearchaeota archaeon]|nr:endonuclease Q family protein [Candidatus Woesearchaeota archaeon]